MGEKNTDLIKVIQNRFQSLSKGQKLIAEFIMNNYDKAAFMTASKLGETVGVSESTVVRFANALDFAGYPDLQKSLQQLIKNKLTTVQRIGIADEYESKGGFLKRVLQSDISNIRLTLDEIEQDTLNQVIARICKAERVYVLGLRSSTALAGYLGFYLNLILDNVNVISFGLSDVLEQIIKINENDLVIVISYPRYSRKTIQALEFAKSRNCEIIGITDSIISPIANLSNYTLIARSNMASFVDSLVAPMSLINALVVGVAMQNREKVEHYFETLENVWDAYDVYEKEIERE